MVTLLLSKLLEANAGALDCYSLNEMTWWCRHAQQLEDLPCPTAGDQGQLLLSTLQRLAPQEELVLNMARRLGQVTVYIRFWHMDPHVGTLFYADAHA